MSDADWMLRCEPGELARNLAQSGGLAAQIVELVDRLRAAEAAWPASMRAAQRVLSHIREHGAPVTPIERAESAREWATLIEREIAEATSQIRPEHVQRLVDELRRKAAQAQSDQSLDAKVRGHRAGVYQICADLVKGLM